MPSSFFRSPIAFILATVVIDTLGFSIIMPVMPALIGSLSGGSASLAARENGWLFCIFAVAQFFSAPVLGNLSDAIGRRPVLIVSLLAFAADYAVMGFAPTIGWIFAGRCFAGIVGATIPTAYAYVSDISDPQTRVKSFGMIGAAFGIGFIIGPALGGAIALLGPRAPFFGAAILAGINAVYGLLCLPETLPAEKRRRFDIHRINPFSAFAELRHRPSLAPLVLAIFFWQLAFTVYPSVWAFFGTFRFHWNPTIIGATLACSGVSLLVVQGVLVGPLVKRFGDRAVVIGGCLFAMLGFTLYGIATASWMIFAIIIICSLSFTVNPALSALLSQRAPDDEQGAVQGVVAAASSVTMIIGPVIMTQLFAMGTSGAPGTLGAGGPFYAAALLAGICLLCALYAMRRPTSESGVSLVGKRPNSNILQS